MAEEGLPFGKKLSEAMAEEQENVQPETEVIENPVIDEPAKTVDEKPTKEEPQKKEEPKKEKETPPTPPTKTWLDEVNESYKTEFKTPEEVGAVLEKAKKVDEYAPKIVEYENKGKEYEKQLEELRSSLNPLSYFSSQESFVAEQLRKQHPDKSPAMLQEIVTKDTSVMDDLMVLVKNEMLENPDLIGGEAGAKEIILDRYGIDPEIPKAEWSTITQNKINIAARTARKAWKELKETVELPKMATPEEKKAEQERLREEKTKNIAPLKETFSKFEKFTEQIDEDKSFEFIVPDEYKEVLPEMFEAYFVDAGLEPTKENLDSIEDLKKGLMLLKHFKQIYKTIEGDVQTREKAERDKLLGNETPTNTQSGTEVEELSDAQKWSEEHGMRKFLKEK